jgi:hypothetical protein
VLDVIPARSQAPGSDQPEGPVAVPPVTTADLVAALVGDWRAALAARSGASALADVDLLGEAQLDLSAAHPSGIAQLFAGRPTRLSNLVREGSALAQARRRARAVGAAAAEHAQRSGIATAFLAIGVATWTEPAPVDASPTAPDGRSEGPDGPAIGDPGATDAARRTVRAPVLLRPVAVSPRGRGEADYDLVLEPSLEVNPVLAAALRARGALLDPAALARAAFGSTGFDPHPALDRLGSLGQAVLDGFGLVDRVVIGTFVHPEQALLDDLDALAPSLPGHEVVAALAGDQRAVDALAHPLPPALRGDRGLDQERGVGDLDPSQAHVLDAIAAGHHLVVDTPPGSDAAGTVAAAVADAAAAGRTVLYVAGHRRAATALADRLADLGLAELALDVAPHAGWRGDVARRLLSAMTVEPVPVDGEKVEIVRRELLDRRSRLAGYVTALHERREPWGCSAYDALQALARLAGTRPAPRTTVRLPAPVAESLTGESRAQAVADLVTVAGLGAFSDATRTSAWFGAELLTPDRATTALARVDRLLEALPRLREQTSDVAQSTGLVPATAPAQWSEQLTMLAGVRHALDVFQPIAFERSAADLVAATATPAWRAERGIEMPGRVRRRLRRQAKDLLRPGRPVADLHAALLDVQHQREVWQAHCPAGGWPRLPEGLARIEGDQRSVAADLDGLAQVLATTRDGGDLAELPWDELTARLQRLHDDQAALVTLPERTALLRDLRKRGLAELVADLERRHVPAGLVGAELDLAWWSAVFEEILRRDPAIGAYDGAALARLAAEFRTLDLRHLADRAVLHRAGSREALRMRLHREDAQARELFGELVEQRFAGLRRAIERYPGVTRHLRPCLVVGPMLVPHVLPPTRSEDLLVLDAAEHLPVELVAVAVARARQVLVVGDTRTATDSALTALAGVLPQISLRSDASRRDPRLTAFLAERAYGPLLTAAPLPSVAGLLRLELVDGTGMPGPGGAVEATAAEVDRVVELVVDHALTRPEETLAVVTASAVHADRVREAVLAQVRDNPALGPFFSPGGTEPFVVVGLDATAGLRRDAIVLSVGFGRTPHGRVLHRFGLVSDVGGRERLLEALGTTRRRLTVVSCFGVPDLDAERLTTPGAVLLRDLLALAAEPAAAGGTAAAPGEATGPDRLVLDLAERLWRMGLTVAVGHGVPGGAAVPLAVGHPDLLDEHLVAVLTDDDAYLAEPSVRVRDRQTAERLERLGWTVVQVWSAAAFLDPQGEADAIAHAVLDACADRARRQPVAVVPELTPEDLAGDDDAAERADAGDAAGDTAEGAAGDPDEGGTGAGDGTVATDGDGDLTASAPAPTEAEPVDDLPKAEPSNDELPKVGLPRAELPQAELPKVGREAGRRGRPTPGADPEPRRPDVARGLPIAAYGDDQLDELAAWLLAGNPEQDDAALAAALRSELGLTKRGTRVDAAVRAAVRRARA